MIRTKDTFVTRVRHHLSYIVNPASRKLIIGALSIFILLVVHIIPCANNDRFMGVYAILSSEKTVAKMRGMFDFDQSVFLNYGVLPFYFGPLLNFSLFYCSGFTSLAFSFSHVSFVCLYQ